MSEQQPQAQPSSRHDEVTGTPLDAPFCPIDLPMQTNGGKFSSASDADETSTADKRDGMPPLLNSPKNSDTEQATRRVAVHQPPKPRRRPKASHDLLIRSGKATSAKPELMEETGEVLHPTPPLPRKPRKSKRQLDRVRRRQMNYLQTRREQKRKRLFYNRLRLMLKMAFAAFWLLVVWEVAHSSLWLFEQPRLSLHNAHWLEAKQLEPIVQTYAGQPVFQIDPQVIAADIKDAYPIVDDVMVRRRLFPARLELTILEKAPWASIYTSEKAKAVAGLITADGHIIPMRAHLADQQPTKNTTRMILAPGQRLSHETLHELHRLSYQLAHIPPLTLQSVDARDLDRVIAHYAEVDVNIGRLDADVSERLARLVPLAPRMDELKADISSVDLRWTKQVTLQRRSHGIPQALPTATNSPPTTVH